VRSPPLLHEAPDELRNLIRCGIEREMARIEDVDLGLRQVAAIGLRDEWLADVCDDAALLADEETALCHRRGRSDCRICSDRSRSASVRLGPRTLDLNLSTT